MKCPDIACLLAPVLLVVILAPRIPAGEPAPASTPGRLALEIPSGARYGFGGPIGARIGSNIDQWLIPAPGANPGMTGMFLQRDRKPVPDLVPWAGEFVGKYLISAIQALRMADREDLRRTVGRVVGEVLASQADDGYLGPFPRKDRLLGNWDLWGHYHVMQALILWSEEAGDGRALQAALRAADLICRMYLDTGRRAFDALSQEMNLAVIHVLGILHRKTGQERYLRMMREIEKDWERCGDYFRTGLAGIEFYRTPRPRWESLHDLQGLVELYRITGDGRYRDAFVNLWRSIRRYDRHNTGGFSTGEQAVGSPFAAGPIETCCTIAWMAITADMLRLTGESAAGDELELSTFNGMLGAQHPSGRWWTYSTPMDGVREASAHAIVFQARAGTPELNCCSVNGPRGLGMLSEWAVLAGPEGPVVCWLGPLKASLALADGTPLSLETETAYPLDGRVRLILHPARKARFTLSVRIPGWSRQTRATSPDGPLAPVRPGTFLEIAREWSDGDAVDLHLDLRLRILPGDREAAGRISVYRGPLLLAWDRRWSPFDAEAIPSLDAKALEGLEALPEPAGDGPLPPWLLVTLQGAGGETVRLCDYASAGAAGTPYRSWLAAVNTPPPEVLLERPKEGEAVPAGKVLFTWQGPQEPPGVERWLMVSRDPAFAQGVLQARAARAHAVLDGPFEPGADWFWKVTARASAGAADSEVRRFRTDRSLPPISEALLEALEPGPGGILIDAPLRGSPVPARGALEDAAGVAAAPGPDGTAGAALEFDGAAGRIRFALPSFPGRDCTVAVRVNPLRLSEGRIAQVFSAWARNLDDPLRITIEGGKISTRIEAEGKFFATEGVPVRPGEWIHVAAVKSGRRLALYIDGVQKASVEVPEVVSTEARDAALGGNPHFGGNEFLAARMAGFVLYGRALTEEEVRALAVAR